MDEITAEQFLESTKTWKPEEGFEGWVDKQLRAAQAPEGLIEDLSKAFHRCSESTYSYIQYIHELATTKEIDRKNFLPQVARLVELVQELRESGREYRQVFHKFDSVAREGLTQDHFDTIYYDAIQNVDIRVLLKRVIEEVEIVLQSFSMVSGELSGTRCIDLYENSIRFQLFLQYFLNKRKFTPEELWSILFDASDQMGDMENLSVEPTEEELRELHEKIQRYKSN
jgi:hypothetical protein